MYVALLALGALDAAGYSIIAPVVPAIAAATGTGPGVMGALVATFAVGMALGFVLAGKGVQWGRTRLVLAAALVLMALGSLGFVLGESLALYFAARLLMGIGSGGLWIGATFAVFERFPDDPYRRLTGLLAVYSVGGIAGPALGAIGGIRGPFLAYLALVGAAAAVVFLISAPRERRVFTSDRSSLRDPGFFLSSAGILLVALALGSLEGPLPLHFSVRLSQAEIGALYVAVSVVVGVSAAAAGKLEPRRTLLSATVLIVAGVALAGATDSLAPWGLALVLAGVGFGLGEAGALGVLLEAVGTERIVLAMVVWSQLWAIGYLAGPALGGAVAEAFGFRLIGLVPLAAATLVVAALAVASRQGARSDLATRW